MKTPKLLKLTSVNALNKKLMDETGCFAFLVPNFIWDYSFDVIDSPKVYVELVTVALYTIYHDYGSGFLKFFLFDYAIDSTGTIGRVINHYKAVINCFRNNVAHGLFDEYSRENMARMIADRYLKKDYSGNWIEFYNSLTEEEWTKVADRICDDSDFLYEYLYDWSDFINSNPFNSIYPVRERFGASDFFINSIDKRIVYNSVDLDFRTDERNARNCSISLYEDEDTAVNMLRSQIVNKFSSKDLCSPEDIIREIRCFISELYQKNTVNASSNNLAREFGFDIPV